MRFWSLAWDVVCELWELAEPIVDVLIEGRGQKTSLD